MSLFWALLAAGLAAQGPAGSGGCALTRPGQCGDTNRLMSAPGTQRAIRDFLGGRKADLLYRGHDVADQVIDVLGGPPDDPVRIGPYWRFTACRAHSCTEKGALVLNPAGTIVAIAVLHGACALSRPGNDCFAHDTLTLYTRHAGPDVVRDLRGWAAAQVQGEGGVAGLRRATLDAVEVVPL